VFCNFRDESVMKESYRWRGRPLLCCSPCSLDAARYSPSLCNPIDLKTDAVPSWRDVIRPELFRYCYRHHDHVASRNRQLFGWVLAIFVSVLCKVSTKLVCLFIEYTQIFFVYGCTRKLWKGVKFCFKFTVDFVVLRLQLLRGLRSAMSFLRFI